MQKAPTVRGMKKKMFVLVVCAVALTGCTGTPAAEPTPTPTQNPNHAACADLLTTFSERISTIQEADPIADAWEELRVNVDEIALTANGDVKERMLALANGWPSVADVFLFNELDDINGKLAAIERACAADGKSIDGLQLTAN